MDCSDISGIIFRSYVGTLAPLEAVCVNVRMIRIDGYFGCQFFQIKGTLQFAPISFGNF